MLLLSHQLVLPHQLTSQTHLRSPYTVGIVIHKGTNCLNVLLAYIRYAKNQAILQITLNFQQHHLEINQTKISIALYTLVIGFSPSQRTMPLQPLMLPRLHCTLHLIGVVSIQCLPRIYLKPIQPCQLHQVHLDGILILPISIT